MSFKYAAKYHKFCDLLNIIIIIICLLNLCIIYDDTFNMDLIR
jgi:hypothetical protein